jgi:hypothetical protein
MGDILLLRDFGPYGILRIYVCHYNRCHGNVVKGIWALLYIYDCTFTTSNFLDIFDGQFTSVHMNAHQNLSCYSRVEIRGQAITIIHSLYSRLAKNEEAATIFLNALRLVPL